MQTLKYQVHISNEGWKDPVKDGEIAGTVGQGKPVEALRIVDMDIPGLGIVGYAKIQDYPDWSYGNIQGEDIGSTGLNKHLEAIKLGLFGEKANDYQLWYRVHVQNIGFMDWVRNGEVAGTEGGNLQIEAIQIILCRTDENIWLASNTLEPYRKIEQPKPAPVDKTEELIAQARSYLGYISGTSEHSIFGEGDYCCHYVRTVCNNVGVEFPNTGWVPDVMDWAMETGRWTGNPERGYAVLFDFNGNGTPDHIGFVQVPYASDHCLTIEGNTDQGNGIGVYEVDRDWGILGYVRLV